MPTAACEVEPPDPEPSGSSAPSASASAASAPSVAGLALNAPRFLLLHLPSPNGSDRFSPMLDRLLARHPGALAVEFCTAASVERLAGVASSPAFLLLRDGELVAEAVGEVPFRELETLVDRAVLVAACQPH